MEYLKFIEDFIVWCTKMFDIYPTLIANYDDKYYRGISEIQVIGLNGSWDDMLSSTHFFSEQGPAV